MNKYRYLLRTFIFAILLLFTVSLEAVYILRYTTIDNGGISYTGNTLGLTKLVGQNQPGTSDSDGAFITTDLSQQVGTYPPGTTLTWQQNRSTAVLDLPAGSTVLYAELIWSGSYGFEGQITGNEPNTPITMITPDSVSHTITPDPATAQAAVTPGFTNSGNYTRSANVTAIVQAAGVGTYTVGGIAATISGLDDTHNAAGWTLAVVYENPNMFTSNLSLFVGCEQATTDTNQPATVTGFCVPPDGTITGRLFISAIEGDANKSGDHMLFGNTLPLTIAGNSIFGSNNPIDNFFSAQINTILPLIIDPGTGKLIAVGSSTLDTRGSFGTFNNNAQTHTNIVGGRQGYDITSIDISSTLVHNQTTAYALGTTTGDDYTINSVALQIQVGAPIIQATKLVNSQTSITASVGDTVTFLTTLNNIGTSTAFNVVFKDILQTGLSYVPGSFKFNGVTQPDPNLNTGFSVGNLLIAPGPGNSATLEFQAIITAPPVSGNLFINTSENNYQFQPCLGNLTDLMTTTNQVIIELNTAPTPPVNFAAKLKKCKYLNKTEYFLRLSWSPSPSSNVSEYRIYWKNQLLAQIPASSPLVFETCLPSRSNASDFSISAVSSGNQQSPPTHLQQIYD